MPAPGCSTGCRPTPARRWRRPPPPRRQYLPAGLAGIHAALVPARTTRPRPPRRSSCTVAACSNSWPPPLRAGRRPPLRRAGRGTTGCWSCSCAAPRRSQPAGAGRQRLLLRVAAHHRHPAPRQRRRRRAAAGRRLGAASRAGRQPDAVLPAARACLPALRRHRGHQPQPLRDAEPHRAGTGAGQGRRRLRLGLSEPAGGRAGRCARTGRRLHRRRAADLPGAAHVPNVDLAAPAASRG